MINTFMLIVIAALFAVSIPNVYASGPSPNDLTIENQEEMCIYLR